MDLVTVVVRVGDHELARTLASVAGSVIEVQVDPIALSRVVEERVTEEVMSRLRARWRGATFA